ncbi:lipoprotein [[Acholeplasma] multilocale]|uniref:lipoprotein n=1 Tax=[Acholeplasma] multilocale TaxID=264638 RepID=UPI0005544D51|nr:lipoprotein [[Acholeplasma] multilocale]
MKKLLTILGAIGLTATAGAAVVACSDTESNKIKASASTEDNLTFALKFEDGTLKVADIDTVTLDGKDESVKSVTKDGIVLAEVLDANKTKSVKIVINMKKVEAEKPEAEKPEAEKSSAKDDTKVNLTIKLKGIKLDIEKTLGFVIGTEVKPGYTLESKNLQNKIMKDLGVKGKEWKESGVVSKILTKKDAAEIKLTDGKILISKLDEKNQGKLDTLKVGEYVIYYTTGNGKDTAKVTSMVLNITEATTAK